MYIYNTPFWGCSFNHMAEIEEEEKAGEWLILYLLVPPVG